MKVRAHAHEIDWKHVVARAAEIVISYDTGVTLRQLYYRLVSEGLIPNRQQAYKTLSMKTAKARREEGFPALIDRTRAIEAFQTFESPEDGYAWLQDTYRRDRTEGQEWSIYIGVEKHGLTTQLMHWFGDLGIPVLALGGYSSQTFVDVVHQHVEAQERPSVLIYAGDFDPSGMDIDRDFEERTNVFDEVRRVALTRKIVDQYELPPMPGKETDSRKAKFILAHGELVQVELDALRPEDLRKLYQRAINKFWDEKAYKKVLRREKKEDGELAELGELVGKDPYDRAETIIDSLDDYSGEDLMALIDRLIDRT